MAKYRVSATMTTSYYIVVSAESKDEAFALAQEADGGDFTPYQNSGSWDLEGDPVLEPTPYQDYLKDNQKKWWGYDKHMRLTELDEEEA